MFMRRETTASSGCRPAMVTSKRPQARPVYSRPLRMTCSVAAGSGQGVKAYAGSGSGVMQLRQVEPLVDVAVIDKAASDDRDQIAAYDGAEIGVGMGEAQRVELTLELALDHPQRAEALDRHV